MKTSLRPFSKLYEPDTADLSAFTHEVSTHAADVLGQKVLEFCHLLRANGIEVTASRIIDTFRALKVVSFFHRGDFYTLLQANLISRATDRELFQQLFLQFWRGPTWAGVPDPCIPAIEDGCELPPPRPEALSLQFDRHDNGQAPAGEKPQHSLSLYSPAEVLSRKDFGKMTEQELLRVQRLIMTMARQMATRLSRRKRAAAKAAAVDPGPCARAYVTAARCSSSSTAGRRLARPRWSCCVMSVGRWTCTRAFFYNSSMGFRTACAAWRPLCSAPV